MNRPKKMILSAIFLLSGLSVRAEVKVEKFEYKDGDKIFEGIVAQDTTPKGPRPAIVVFHNWMGVSAETEGKITELAKLGIVAFAADIYGKGIRQKDAKEAGELAGFYKKDRKLLRDRVNLALKELRKMKVVDESKLFASGYCFGGTAALELARSGADVLGVISFHGGLGTPTPEDAKNIKAHLQIHHGKSDPFVPADEVKAFKKEMDEAKVRYEFHAYPGAVHSFTEKGAGSVPSKGAAYNAEADQKSWAAMVRFLSEQGGMPDKKKP